MRRVVLDGYGRRRPPGWQLPPQPPPEEREGWRNLSFTPDELARMVECSTCDELFPAGEPHVCEPQVAFCTAAHGASSFPTLAHNLDTELVGADGGRQFFYPVGT